MATIILKNGSTGGVIPTGLTHGEPAVNTADSILFCGDSGGNTINLTGVKTVNGLTGDVTVTDLVGVETFNGSTGAVTGVASFNGLTGTVTTDALTLNVTGISASSGITSWGPLAITGANNFIIFPDGTTQSNPPIQRWYVDNSLQAGCTYYNEFELASTSDVSISTIGASGRIKYLLATSNLVPKTDISNTFTNASGNIFTTPIGSNRYAGNNSTEVYAAILDHASSTYMGVTSGTINFKVLGTEYLTIDSTGISAGGATFGSDVTINSAGDVALTLNADTDNSGENDNPLIKFTQDGGYYNVQMGMVGDAGQFYTNSTDNAGFIETAGDTPTDLQFATNGALRMSIDGHTGGIHILQGISADAGATFGGAVNFTNDSTYMAGALRHIGDTNTKLQFGTGTVTMRATDNIFLDATTTGVDFPLGLSAASANLAGATIGGYWAGVQEETIGVSVNNGSQVLTTGVKGHRTLPYACDIIDWRVTSTDSGAIEWGINYCTYANFPTMTAIATTSEAPGIAATGSKNEGDSAGIAARWDKYQFDAGEIIEFEIDSVTTLTNCILELTIRRTS